MVILFDLLIHYSRAASGLEMTFRVKQCGKQQNGFGCKKRPESLNTGLDTKMENNYNKSEYT